MIEVMVTYKVKADRVEENERLVRAVYEGLADAGAEGVHYATFRKEDGQWKMIGHHTDLLPFIAD